MYIYICMYICIYMDSYIHVYVYIYIYVCIYICVHIHAHTHTRTHTYANPHIYANHMSSRLQCANKDRSCCVAVCCSLMQCGAVCCANKGRDKDKSSESYCTYEKHCNALQHTATHCNTLQHTATHCTRTSQASLTTYMNES